jgi:predicted  nucleic acid-binding Zn-ribbon protein
MTAKKKVAAAPVDQEETFVSLAMSKNLGDSEASVEEKLRTLYKIQQTDTEIDKIYLLRGELPLEVKDIEDEIEGLNTRIAHAKADIAEAEGRIAECEHRVAEAEEALAKYNAQRDNVKNNREYESISKEIEYQELEITAARKHIGEAKLLIDARNGLVEETQSVLSLRNDDLEAKRKELESIVAETAKDEERLLAAREELVTKIDQRMLNAYERVRKNTHNKLAVVTVQRDACGGCFNKIPPQRRLDIEASKRIIVCEYCGRILVSSAFGKEE